MRVIKRSGAVEDVSFDKVLNRLKNLSSGFGEAVLNVDIYDIAQKVCARIYNNVSTTELDELAAHICSSLIIDHPDYGKLASRIIVSNHHKNTSPSFSETIQMLYTNTVTDGERNPLVSDEVYDVVMRNKEKLNTYIDYSRDFEFDYFGFKTLERSYLMKVGSKVVERPQHMFMRVALGIHGGDIKDALQTYDGMSKKLFIHATPTLFNAGTMRPQMSSCFLMSTNDSIAGIYDALSEAAHISKYAGGIGMHIHGIRAKGSRIRGTNGNSTGVIPMLRVFNSTARYVNQCFTPETTVFAKRGVLRMDQVKPGDELITVDGTFKNVNSVSIKGVDETILQIRTKYSLEPIKVTKQHEMYVIPNQTKGLNFDVIKNRLDKNIVAPQYMSASELTTDDLVGYPIPVNTVDIDEDADFCRFYGIMIGDGHIYKRKHNTSQECGITLNMQSKSDAFVFCTKFLGSRNIHYWVNNDAIKSTVSIRWTVNMSKLAIDYESVYENDEKYIHPKFLNMPTDKSLALLQGLIETDGSNLKELYFHNTSKNVVMCLRHVLLRLGILTSGYVKDEVNKSHCIVREDGSVSTVVNRKKCYVLRIPKHKNIASAIKFTPYNKVGFFEHQGILWSRISEIVPVEYSGYVYDFNMMDNHNYTVANFGLVHNSGKRNGSIAVYLEPWHADIENFLELRKPHGNDEERTRDMFLAMWISDLFMKRVKENGMWSLMCPDVCKGLQDTYGEEFERLYETYEKEGRYVKQVPAQKIWFKMLESQIESGQPYMLYKDTVNMKSNQANIGIIKSSNLCTEICEVSNDDETAVCNLASIALPSFVEHGQFNFLKLHDVTKVVTKNLNKVIDANFYPVEKARRSNMRHRPIGIGVQGLADLFAILKMPFDSQEAATLNRDIFETIYHGALEASMELSRKGKDEASHNEFDPSPDSKYPGAYATFEGSPASKGILQYDMWNVQPSARYDWNTLKQDIQEHGLRNSLLLAPMPTASTSQILGFNECFEPFTSNLYKRKTLAGEFILVNKYLLKDLLELGLWNKEIKDKIIIADGSIQGIDEIPQSIKDLYKTVWEIKQKCIIDLAADRGAFICQSQSMNLFMEDPDFKKLTSMHFYAWQKGLKTGMYYLRSKPKAQAQKFTIDPTLNKLTNLKTAPSKTVVCTDEVCTVCSS